MRAELSHSIEAFDAREWNRLVGSDYPFLRHEFLLAAEQSGCVSAATGWTPRHVAVRNARGRLKGAMPLYEKTHSWGEFVFDWSWAQAYHQAGFDYYPKLVSAVPFTPAPSPRLLAADDHTRAALLDAALGFARERGHSSLHVLFPLDTELDDLRDAGLKIRKDCQFHWQNRGYRSFDGFLETFSAAKRKKVRRERRRVREQGIRFRRLDGQSLDRATWTDIYELISMTFLRRGSMPYFSLEFFVEVSSRLPQALLVVLAERDGEAVAAAVFFRGGKRLYGRYWGAAARYNALHFETCYYQGIEYCIEHGLEVFEPGTQGEHKISRGFLPVETWSAHWLERPEFFSAVGRYLRSESRHVDDYIDAVNAHSPYRSGQIDAPDGK